VLRGGRRELLLDQLEPALGAAYGLGLLRRQPLGGERVARHGRGGRRPDGGAACGRRAARRLELRLEHRELAHVLARARAA
jgi:hypothetical protein